MLCRPPGTRSFPLAYPALPCRALDCSVPAGLDLHPLATDLLSHSIHFQIALRGNAEGVGYAVEEGEHRCDVDGFGNLGLSPTVLAQDLYVFRSRAIGCLGHLSDVVE